MLAPAMARLLAETLCRKMQLTSNYMSLRYIPKVYNLMQDQLSLYVTLSGFTKRTAKVSNKVI